MMLACRDCRVGKGGGGGTFGPGGGPAGPPAAVLVGTADPALPINR
jgi:hypothetical protein